MRPDASSVLNLVVARTVSSLLRFVSRAMIRLAAAAGKRPERAMKRSIATALAVLLGAFCASAQDWPTRMVRIVVPFAAGATRDLVARLIADRMQQQLGQTFIVENRPGASGNTGTDD